MKDTVRRFMEILMTKNNTQNGTANTLKTGVFFLGANRITSKTGAFQAAVLFFHSPKTGDYSIYTSPYRGYLVSLMQSRS